jgi:O-antigen/teichoic acid export membrane protein
LKASVYTSFFYQILLSGSQVLLPLISYPYIARVLGPAAIGRVNYVDFLAQIAMIIAGFGIPFYAVRAVALVKNNALQRATLVKEIVTLHLAFSVLVVLIFAWLFSNQINQYPLLYIFAMANILLNAFGMDWYLQGTEAFGFAARRAVFARLLMLIAFFVGVKTPADAAVYLGIFTMGSFVLAAMAIRKVLQENKFNGGSWQPVRHIQPLLHFFITSAAISSYIYLDAVLLQQIGKNETHTGYYTSVIKIVKVCLTALLAIGAVMLPRMSQVAQTGNLALFRQHTHTVLQTIFTLALPACMGLALLAPEIVEVLAGRAFLPAVPLMQWLAVLPLLIGLSNIFAFQVLVPLHQEKKFLLAAVAGCVVSIALNIWLIPGFGAMGTAWANISTETTVTVITGFFAWKIIRFHIPIAPLLKTVVCCLLFVPIIFACRLWLSSALPVLLASIILCFGIYLLLQLRVFKNTVLLGAANWLKQIVALKKTTNGEA